MIENQGQNALKNLAKWFIKHLMNIGKELEQITLKAVSKTVKNVQSKGKKSYKNMLKTGGDLSVSRTANLDKKKLCQIGKELKKAGLKFAIQEIKNGETNNISYQFIFQRKHIEIADSILDKHLNLDNKNNSVAKTLDNFNQIKKEVDKNRIAEPLKHKEVSLSK